jgi:hypothetical protein
MSRNSCTYYKEKIEPLIVEIVEFRGKIDDLETQIVKHLHELSNLSDGSKAHKIWLREKLCKLKEQQDVFAEKMTLSVKMLQDHKEDLLKIQQQNEVNDQKTLPLGGGLCMLEACRAKHNLYHLDCEIRQARNVRRMETNALQLMIKYGNSPQHAIDKQIQKIKAARADLTDLKKQRTNTLADHELFDTWTSINDAVPMRAFEKAYRQKGAF